MRILSATLTAGQKAKIVKALVKIRLTQGANDYTYTQTRILSLNHIEEVYSQTAEVLLDNADGTLTSIDFKGYKGVISYGITTSAGDEYSASAPLWVVGSQLISTQGGLGVRLTLAGTPNFFGEIENLAGGWLAHAASPSSAPPGWNSSLNVRRRRASRRSGASAATSASRIRS